MIEKLHINQYEQSKATKKTKMLLLTLTCLIPHYLLSQNEDPSSLSRLSTNILIHNTHHDPTKNTTLELPQLSLRDLSHKPPISAFALSAASGILHGISEGIHARPSTTLNNIGLKNIDPSTAYNITYRGGQILSAASFIPVYINHKKYAESASRQTHPVLRTAIMIVIKNAVSVLAARTTYKLTSYSK